MTFQYVYVLNHHTVGFRAYLCLGSLFLAEGPPCEIQRSPNLFVAELVCSRDWREPERTHQEPTQPEPTFLPRTEQNPNQKVKEMCKNPNPNTVLVGSFTEWNCRYIHTFHNRRGILLPAGCREAANCRYCFYSQAKNQVFRPAGATRCTDSGQKKFHVNQCRRAGMRPPKYQKNSTFW